ncbi:MAG: hypothetical protein P8X90_18435 [Desulfobacterales bacterium]
MMSSAKNKSFIKYDVGKCAGRRELGEIQNLIKLKKQNTPPSKKGIEAFLIQTIKGVWILDPERQDPEKLIDLWNSGDLRYHSKMAGDLIEVEGQRFKISPGDGGSAKRALAVGRFLHDHVFSDHSRCIPAFESEFVEKFDRLWKIWLQTTLRPAEHLLALLETSTKISFEKSILDSASAYYHFVLTTHRNLLAAISEAGDVDSVELPRRQLEIEHSIGRSSVRCGDDQWTTTVTNESVYKKIREIAGQSPVDALRAVGLIIWQGSGFKKIGSVRKIFEILRSMDGATPLDAVTGFIINYLKDDKNELDDAAEQIQQDLAKAFREIRKSERSSQYLIEWFRQWGFPISVGEEVLKYLLNIIETAEDARWALPFHRHIYEMRTKTTKKMIPLILFDIAMIEHLILAEQYGSAKEIIQKRLEQLPSQELLDLLPARDEDITEAPGWQQIRVRLLELLNIAKQHLNEPTFETVFALAVHKPFELSRIEQLENFDNHQIAARAGAVKQLLSRQGLQPGANSDRLVLSGVSPLSRKDLELLRHPLTRKGKILGKLQGALARTSTPEFSHLRQFCKKATAAEEPLIIDIVGQVCLALGLRVVPAYLSHGEKSVGVRAFEGDPNFILIGSKHVASESEYFLAPLELTFAIATELTHVRFKHSRVTSRAVLGGTLEKGKFAIETIAALLPFLKFIPFDKIMSKSRSGAPLNLLKRIYGVEDGRQLMSKVGGGMSPLLTAGSDGVKKLQKGIRGSSNPVEALGHSKDEGRDPVTADDNAPADIGPSNDKLVVAHRVMQLTADRAGIVFCGDISAAVRSMFLTSRTYQPELYLAQKNDLAACLKRCDEKGNYILQDLAVRIGSLIAFFLSDDYQQLRLKIED